jgi:hypothetical protein
MSLIRNLFESVERSLFGAVASAVVGAFQDGANAKSPSDYQPGDVTLTDIVLMSEGQDRVYSLMKQCVGFDIYESIMSPVMFAEVVISDSMGLLQSFPIIGEEYIKISFSTPKLKGAPATFLFRVNSVKDKKVTESTNKITYTLQCVSAELIHNSKQLVNIKESNTADNIIKRIFEEFLPSQKQLNIASTSGILDVLITRYAPLQAIDYVRQKAISSRYESSSFCFYENRNGFNFVTIEQLMEQGAKTIEAGNSDKIFFFDASRKDNAKNVTTRNIIAYNQIQFGDTISQIKSGGLNNQVQQFDLITGDVTKVTYTDNEGADRFKSSSSSGASGKTTSFTSNHGRSTTVATVFPMRSDKPEIDMAGKMAKVRAFAQKLSQNIIQIHIYGDSTINIGDMIECRLPAGSDAKSIAGESRLDSGNYLVAKVRHIVLNSDRPQYTQALELIKTDLQEVTS